MNKTPMGNAAPVINGTMIAVVANVFARAVDPLLVLTVLSLALAAGELASEGAGYVKRVTLWLTAAITLFVSAIGTNQAISVGVVDNLGAMSAAVSPAPASGAMFRQWERQLAGGKLFEPWVQDEKRMCLVCMDGPWKACRRSAIMPCEDMRKQGLDRLPHEALPEPKS